MNCDSDDAVTAPHEIQQLVAHVPDMVVYRSHEAALPQTIYSYGVVMFVDISGENNIISKMYIILCHTESTSLFSSIVMQDSRLSVRCTAPMLNQKSMEQTSFLLL